MALEIIEDELIMAPAGFDPHWHVRALDALVQSNGEHIDGKAGVREYTRIALASGYSGGITMPNESIRTGRLDGGVDEQGYNSELHPHPISTLDTVFEMEQRIATEAVVDTGIFFGLDPSELYLSKDSPLDRDKMRRHFADVKGRVMGLKIYGEETEGGYAIRVHDVPDAIEDWQLDHVGEPVVLHLEGENVGLALRDVIGRKGGHDWAVHIAHVSSRVELEAIIEAKQAGMNITCEVTPHHLFLFDVDQKLLGGQGCMKPSLKSQADVDFLWANLNWIDMIGSDCAPHRPGDKQGQKFSWGVTNQPLLIPLLITEALKPDGRVSLERLEDMVCIKPRQRFNVPLDDGSKAVFALVPKFEPSLIERRMNPGYHETPFVTYQKLRPAVAYERFGVQAFLIRSAVQGSSFDNRYADGHATEQLTAGFQRILRPLGKLVTTEF